jgi:hypothetical protein
MRLDEAAVAPNFYGNENEIHEVGTGLFYRTEKNHISS